MNERSDEVKIAILETEVRGLRESIKLQAVEYERRLTELNHAHAQAVLDKAQYLNTDLFYAKMDDLQKWKVDVDKWRARVVGIATGIGFVSGAAASIFLRLLK